MTSSLSFDGKVTVMAAGNRRKVFGAGYSAPFTLDPRTDALPGICFTTENGQRTFDNTYASRLAKMKDELRLLTVN